MKQLLSGLQRGQRMTPEELAALVEAQVDLKYLRQELKDLRAFVQKHMEDEEEDRKLLNQTLETMNKKMAKQDTTMLVIMFAVVLVALQVSTGVDLISWLQGWF